MGVRYRSVTRNKDSVDRSQILCQSPTSALGFLTGRMGVLQGPVQGS